MANKFNIYCY